MTYVPHRRGTLLIPSGPDGMHLFVTMNNRCANHFHLLFSVTSIRAGKDFDGACTFDTGDHPFISLGSEVFPRQQLSGPSGPLAH